MPRARVLLADDHTIVAQGLASLLEDEFELVGVVGDGDALLAAARKLRPEVVVADMAMPVLSGLEALRQLRKEGSDCKVIFLTMHADAALASAALRAGASAYLLKHSAGDELIRAIGEVLEGRVYLTPLLARDVLPTQSGTRAEVKLTPRQREVLGLIAEGRTMKQIAAALGLSRRTVESHKYDMMAALGVTTTAELIRYALQLGVVAL
ncbi:MAG: response regulator transcription factor [Gemmataceae bacterium]|nr:response regulator transcription factor [Gemmataceae bacterium]